MMVLLYAPLQIVLAVFFLTQILSWSALIGMLVLVVTLPLPGLCAKYMNDVQKELMEASEVRIGRITEAINSLRMIKAFAWEEKVKEQLAAKREIELGLSRKKQFLSQVSVAVQLHDGIPRANSRFYRSSTRSTISCR